MLIAVYKGRRYTIKAEDIGTRNHGGRVYLGGACLSTWEAGSMAGNVPKTLEDALEAAHTRAETMNLQIEVNFDLGALDRGAPQPTA